MKRILVPALLLCGAASAAEPPDATTYRSECGECHIAYPARLLPQASWQAVMRRLDQHFGVDASLDPDTARAIGAWLDANAGSRSRREHEKHEGRSRQASPAPRDARPGEPVLRISEMPWFVHEHDEVAASTWKRDSIRSASNCEACHTRAAQGDFEDESLRIPK